MTIRPLFYAAALTAVLLPLASQAQTAAPAPAPAAVTLRYKFTPGEVLRYKMTMDMDMTMSGLPGTTPPPTTPMKSHMEMVYRQTVKDVRASDGAATLVGKYENMTMTMNGHALPGNPMMGFLKMDFIRVMLPTGKLLSFRLDGGTTAAKMPDIDLPAMGMNLPATLPTGAVKVGDTWDTGTDVSRKMTGSGMPGVQMTFHSTLMGLDKTEGTTIASIGQIQRAAMGIKSPASSPADFNMTGAVAGTGTTKFDVEAGAIASMDMTATMHSTTLLPKAAGGAGAGGRPFHMTMKETMHMERLPSQP